MRFAIFFIVGLVVSLARFNLSI